MSMLRIVSGRYGGRRIQTPRGQATRPTAEKVRAALFNSLEHAMNLQGARVVDLYAGSGALGIEALSRGAAHATFVESDARTAALLRDNLATLEIAPEVGSVAVQKAHAWLRHAPTDPLTHLVLLDPPYAAGEYNAILPALAMWPGLADGAILAVESAARDALPPPPGLEALRSKRYGDTQLDFFVKASGQAQPK
jgi:16S rRNA (guanine966-N2)-methyltransferase